MRLLHLTLPTPEENLALEEALLEECESGRLPEVLRFWSPPQPFVVLGMSNALEAEVNLPSCQALGIPVLRRFSGGGTVLQGPGCLNFSLLLRIRPGELSTIAATHRHVLERHRRALQPLVAEPVRLLGHSDLALGRKKFSGNAQRRGKEWLLYHGTFLLEPDLSLMERLLPLPSRQPAYRRNRSHREFLTRLPLPPAQVKRALIECWDARGSLNALPLERRTRTLAQERYAAPAWTTKF